MLIESKVGNKLCGFYRGQVLKHLPHGFCKIYIPGVYSEDCLTDPNLVPDAEQAAPLFAGTNSGNGTFSYPNLSSMVWCFFANNDQNFPVYFASTLGGQNAFGQFEIVRDAGTDVVSDKHLVTSGKSQIEIYESGKISAYVTDPIRTEASVDFDNTCQLDKQDDAVSLRPMCTMIDTFLTSSTNCQFVMDNEENDGEVRSSTHRYQLLSSEGKITTIDVSDIKNNIPSHETRVEKIYLTKKKQLSCYTYDYKDEWSQNCETFTTELDLNNKKVVQLATTNYSMSSSGNTGLTCTSDNVVKKTHYEKQTNTSIGIQHEKLSDSVKTNDFVEVTVDKQGIATIDFSNQIKNITAKVNIDATSGEMSFVIKSPSGKSEMSMTSGGAIAINATNSITLNATNSIDIISKNITLNGSSTITETTNTLDASGSTVNIAGSSGDCKIQTISLVKHIHPVPPHCPSMGVTAIPL